MKDYEGVEGVFVFFASVNNVHTGGAGAIYTYNLLPHVDLVDHIVRQVKCNINNNSHNVIHSVFSPQSEST